LRYLVTIQKVLTAHIEVYSESPGQALKDALVLEKQGCEIKWRTGETYAKDVDALDG